MHEKVHEESKESRGSVHFERALRLRSLQLGLSGMADVVELHRQPDGFWQPYPVEYKRGKVKRDNSDRVQLCAQSLCLEEMLQVRIPQGALFYGKTRRRHVVEFDDALRSETALIARQVHELLASGRTPGAVYEKKCDSCSMIEVCMPATLGRNKPVEQYLQHMLDKV